MALILYTVTVIDHVNNPNNTLANTDIVIRTTQAGAPLAIIYADEDGLIPIAQPGAKTNDLGVFEFYAASANYNFTATVNGETRKIGGVNASSVMTENSGSVQDFIDDYDGFTAALLEEAGIVDDGQPDTVGDSQRVDAIKKITLNSFLPATLSARLVDPQAFEGLVVDVQDRPESKFKYVLAGSVDIDGYNIIQCSAPIATLALKRINYQQTDLLAQTYFGSELSNINVVITGDSLSFNGYGYDPAWGVTGTGYATDQWFGLSSWSHLVRDFIVSSNPAFKSIFDINWYSNGGVVSRGIADAEKRYFGMNGRVITFNFPNSTSKVVLEANSALQTGLLVSATAEAFAYKFTVDGIEYDNVTDYPNNYYGGGYKIIPCGIEPVITNVRQFTTLAVGGEFSIYGITSSTAGGANAKFPMITGKGGYKSSQVLAEYNTLVKPYLPDVVFYMIGANDIDSGVPVATFKSNIDQFVDLVRADSPNAKVILLTTTPVARPPWVDGQERPYIAAMREICDDKYCYLVNVFDEFRNIDPYYWRFDNTHFNKRGDDMMFNLIKDKIFPSLPIDRNKFTPLREFYSGLLGLDGKRKQLTNYIEVTATATTPTITEQQNGNFKSLCTAAYVVDGANTLLRVTMPDGYSLSSAEAFKTSYTDSSSGLNVKSSSANVVDIFRSSSGAIAPIAGSGDKILLAAGRLYSQV